jgi:hypothetical protein
MRSSSARSHDLVRGPKVLGQNPSNRSCEVNQGRGDIQPEQKHRTQSLAFRSRPGQQGQPKPNCFLEILQQLVQVIFPQRLPQARDYPLAEELVAGHLINLVR